MREDSSSLASPDPEYTAQTRVLELELQGVTRADKGQDSCRLVTRDRNLPINQHDRSRSPGTSERRASSCRWRPRRPQSPECWLQGSLLLSHCLETDSYNQRPELRTGQWLCVVQNNESNIPILYNSIQLEGTWSFNTSCTILGQWFFHMAVICTATPCSVLDTRD